MKTEHMPITKILEGELNNCLNDYEDTNENDGKISLLEDILPQVRTLEGEIIARAHEEERSRVVSILEEMVDTYSFCSIMRSEKIEIVKEAITRIAKGEQPIT